MDLIDLKRLVTALVMPLSVSVGLAVLALVFLLRRRTRPAITALAVSLLWIIVFSLPVTAKILMGALEADHPPQLPASCVPAQAIIVLGGAVRPALEQDPQFRLRDASDRVTTAAALFHAGCAPIIFVAAGGKHRPPLLESEAAAITRLLISLGVPSGQVMSESTSRDTSQNAMGAWQVLMPRGVKRVLLVTSAWHLPRAIREFQGVGFEVQPFGADYRSGDAGQFPVREWLPDAQALAASHLAVKEYLGRLVQGF